MKKIWLIAGILITLLTSCGSGTYSTSSRPYYNGNYGYGYYNSYPGYYGYPGYVYPNRRGDWDDYNHGYSRGNWNHEGGEHHHGRDRD